MPNLPAILLQLAHSLRQDGADVGGRPLEVVSAVMSFLQAGGNSLDDEIAAAAYLTAQLMPLEARNAAIALGVPAGLIPQLEPTPTGADQQLALALARGNRQQATIAASVLYAWHAVATDHKRAASLRECASIAQSGSKHPDLAAMLVAEMAKILPLPQAPHPLGSRYFSISIDLCGSTEAKTRATRVADEDSARIDKLNADICRAFFGIERQFYQNAASRYGAYPAIDPAQFFVVKGIGDEIWIMCEPSDSMLAQTGHALIDAGLQVASKVVELVATRHEDGPSFNPDFDCGNVDPIQSPVKVFMDLMDQATCLGTMRDDALRDAVPELLRYFHGREPTSVEEADVTRRLCLADNEPLGWWKIGRWRADYVGHEIDRFFRASKAALPGTVTIGAAMVKGLGLSFRPTAVDAQSVWTGPDTPLRGGTPNDPVHAVTRTLDSEQMKGIGYPYDTHTLFAPRSLSANYAHMAANRLNGFPTASFDDTAEEIPPEVARHVVIGNR